MAGSGKAQRLGRPAAFSRYKDRTSLAVLPFSSIFPSSPAASLASSWVCGSLPPTIADRSASTVHEAFRQTAFVSILGPPTSRPRPSDLPGRTYGLSERHNRALSFAPPPPPLLQLSSAGTEMVPFRGELKAFMCSTLPLLIPLPLPLSPATVSSPLS